MTFLLFLASLAILEGILRRPERTPDERASSATPGLEALGRTLDEYGRGQVPQQGRDMPVESPPKAD
jgi:hypothetical protein